MTKAQRKLAADIRAIANMVPIAAQVKALAGNVEALRATMLAVADRPAEEAATTLAALARDTLALSDETARVRNDVLRRLREQGWSYSKIARLVSMDRGNLQNFLTRTPACRRPSQGGSLADLLYSETTPEP